MFSDAQANKAEDTVGKNKNANISNRKSEIGVKFLPMPETYCWVSFARNI